MDHRLGYPAVLRALFGAPAARVLPVYAAWPPIGGTTEGDKASTAEHDAKNAPKPVKRDEPYRPEFDFQYVDRKGHLSDTVIPKRDEPAALRSQPESIITPLAPSAGVVADAPTEWQSGPPPAVGFYATSRCAFDPVVRFWNGHVWSLRLGGRLGGRTPQSLMNMADREPLDGIEWRGPRLVGADWPEPQA